MTPNPGSREARTRGCRCPVGPNNDGLTPPFEEGYYTVQDCPMHGVADIPHFKGGRWVQ